MTSEPVSVARPRADQGSVSTSAAKVSFQGYHHVTHLLPVRDGALVVKCREPRDRILWFDRRCFQSEEELLGALAKLDVTQVPEIVAVEGMDFQVFIEGRTLGSYYRSGRPVPQGIFDQIVQRFRETIEIRPERLSVGRRCGFEDRPEDGDSAGFLERLIVFTEEQVYRENQERFGELFRALGVGDESFARIREHVAGLTDRPFSLLHADLHRENFIVDPRGGLWTIDWELAMVGDPLYDLATHLYLMRYPRYQAERMAEEWCEAAEHKRPGSSKGWEEDLPRILAYKKAQSVFTDVIRMAMALRDGSELTWAPVLRTAGKLRKILGTAAEPLGLTDVPGQWEIREALDRWLREPDSGRPGA
ncbi:aminoglycoside phosphotransferase family protein [Streptomyces sp. NPDC046862]|uniref:aminoglycoside phosphotransferase family protein n=1 Tax=Streptomyces sp. NPDC046862 TaxID=3154603 RepID=UPI0034532A1B